MRGVLFSFSFLETTNVVKVNTFYVSCWRPLTTLTDTSILRDSGVRDPHLICIYIMFACYNKDFD